MSDILLCRCKQGTSKSKAKQSKWSEALTQHTQQFTTSLHCNFTSICNRFCVRSDILRHRSWGVRFTVISHTVPVVARIIIVPLWIFMGRPKFSETASSSPFLFPRMTWITALVLFPLMEWAVHLEVAHEGSHLRTLVPRKFSSFMLSKEEID